MKKRIVSILLVIVLAVSLCSVGVFADKAEPTDGTKYQTVFIHGLLGFGYNDGITNLICYWGCTSGNMIDYLNDNGYDVVNASVGPASSCWDRCCELFAQLTGTVTDYGAVHSAKVEAAYANDSHDLKHDRYGRDYTGAAIVKDWGPIYKDGKVTGWYDNKLNLIGHSFGGPTSTMLLSLLAEGNQDEINWGKEQAKLRGGDWHDYVSPLFWGDYDGEYLINSVTSLAGVLNGTTYLDICDTESEIIMSLVTYAASTLGNTDFSYIYDFQLEHFGISSVTDLNPSVDTLKAFFETERVSAFLDGYDNALYDLSVQGCNELKQGWDTYDNVYYFSYAGNKTYKDPITGHYLPDPDMFPLFIPFGTKIGSYEYSFEQVKDIHNNFVSNITPDWFPNDGMVNTISARYPFGAPQKEYDAGNIERGIWQWMDMDYDHMTFCGGILDPNIITQPQETKRFYNQLMSNIAATTPVDKTADPVVDPTDDPVVTTDPFTDIADSGYHDYIVEAAEKGIVNGFADGTFRPNADVTRAQFITMLWRAAGEPSAKADISFADADKIADAYKAAVAWGVKNGVILGYEDNTFRPDQNISRAQMATFMYRYLKDVAGYDFGKVEPVSFSDAGTIADAYKDAVDAIVSAGIMNGMSNTTFAPDATANRGMSATVMLRMYNLLK